MRPYCCVCFRMPHRSLQTCGSRRSLAPIVFQEGRDLVSCFMLASSRSSASDLDQVDEDAMSGVLELQHWVLK